MRLASALVRPSRVGSGGSRSRFVVERRGYQIVHASRNLGGNKWSDIPSPRAISSGRALSEITPEQPQAWDLPSWTAVEDIGRDTAEIDESLLPASNTGVFIEAPGSLLKVLSYVAYLGESTTNIHRFNEMLREAGHDLRLTSD